MLEHFYGAFVILREVCLVQEVIESGDVCVDAILPHSKLFELRESCFFRCSEGECVLEILNKVFLPFFARQSFKTALLFVK